LEGGRRKAKGRKRDGVAEKSNNMGHFGEKKAR